MLNRAYRLANGMVQAGERIVDRGEIIDNHTYNVLRSLKAIHEAKTGGTQTQGIILAGQFVLVFGLMFCFWLYLWSFRLKIFHNRKNALFLDPLHIRELHPYGTMCYLRIIQRIYIAVRHRTDRSTYLLRFPDGAFHAPYHRADLLVDGTFPA